MAWNERGRRSWIRRDERPAPSPTIAPPPRVPASVLVLPNIPAFSPSAIAKVLQKPKSTVGYWIKAGKLESYLDPIGEVYVRREILVDFVRSYLGQACA